MTPVDDIAAAVALCEQANKLLGTAPRAAYALLLRARELAPAEPIVTMCWATVSHHLGGMHAPIQHALVGLVSAPGVAPSLGTNACIVLSRLAEDADDIDGAEAYLDRARAFQRSWQERGDLPAAAAVAAIHVLEREIELAINRGQRARTERAYKEAIAVAERHQLSPHANSLGKHYDALLSAWNPLHAAIPFERAGSSKRLQTARVLERLHGAAAGRERFLQAIKKLENEARQPANPAGPTPATLWSAYLEFLHLFADHRPQEDEPLIDCATKAVAIAQQLDTPSMSAQTRLAVRACSQVKWPDALLVWCEESRARDVDSDPETLREAMQAECERAIEANDPSRAQRALQRLELSGNAPAERVHLALLRTVIARMQEDLPRRLLAFEDLAAALADHFVANATDGSGEQTAYLLFADTIGGAVKGAAMTAHRSNRPALALQWLDRGKAALSAFDNRLAAAALRSAVDLDQLERRLQQDGAALLMLHDRKLPTGRSEILCVGLDVHGASHSWLLDRPETFETMLPDTASHAGQTGPVLATELMELGRLFAEPLRTLAGEARHLYVVPEGALWRVPWSALNLDGAPVFTTTSCSIIPSARWLLNVPSRPSPISAMVSIGVGHESWNTERIVLGALAEQAASLFGHATVLLDDQATKSDVLDALTRHDLAYLIVHGSVETGRDYDALAATRLKLGLGMELTGRDLAIGPQLAHTVIINACCSGGFSMVGHDVLSGFYHGLFRRGTQRAILSLGMIDPNVAHRVALRLIPALVERESLAQALRQAQLAEWQRGESKHDWFLQVALGAA